MQRIQDLKDEALIDSFVDSLHVMFKVYLLSIEENEIPKGFTYIVADYFYLMDLFNDLSQAE